MAGVARDAGHRASGRVSRCGVGQGGRVAFTKGNFPEWVISYQAATSIGAVAVAMNALWQSDEMEYGLKDCGAKIFIADQERLDRLAGCSPDLDVPVIAVRADRPGKAPRYEDLMAEAAGATLPSVDIAPDDDATISYPPGSPGHPKGACPPPANIRDGNAVPMDIGNQIAVGIGMSGAWAKCHLCRQTRCRSQSRPFTHQ